MPHTVSNENLQQLVDWAKRDISFGNGDIPSDNILAALEELQRLRKEIVKRPSK